MEKTNREKVKEGFLIGFVVLCVGLIVSIWFGALTESDVDNPYFYRGVPEVARSFDATETAMAMLITSTATPEASTPTSTATPTPLAEAQTTHMPTLSPTPDILLDQ